MRSPYRHLKLFIILFPPLLIGTAEYVRHEWWLNRLSMESGNLLITLIVFVLSLVFGEFVFRRIELLNSRLAQEQAKQAVYQERERLADELHDNIAQTLFFLNVKLQKQDQEGVKSAVAEINNHLRQAIFNLKSPPEEAENFPKRLNIWLEEWSRVSGIICDIHIHLEKDSLTTAQEVKLLGLIQEAFTNIRKHSQATRSSIAFTGDSRVWSIRIWDDGIGIPHQEGSASNRKYGITMMAKRAEDLGALFSVAALERGGTEIRVVYDKKGGSQ